MQALLVDDWRLHEPLANGALKHLYELFDEVGADHVVQSQSSGVAHRVYRLEKLVINLGGAFLLR
jgi:hypothetical protein